MRAGASDDELREVISRVWQVRQDRYSELRVRQANVHDKPEMYYIGG